MQTTLAKWGNSNGIRIPADICAELGVTTGDVADLELDAIACSLTLRFSKSPTRGYRRHRKMTMEEFAAGWEGGKTGTEEWGGCDVGAEAVL